MKSYDPFYFDRTFCANGKENCPNAKNCERCMNEEECEAAKGRMLSFSAFFRSDEKKCEYFIRRIEK